MRRRPAAVGPRQRRLGLRQLDGAGRDRGATLIFALILVTVVALIVTALVSLAMQYTHTSELHRDGVVTAEAVDGAANIGLNALRRDDFVGGSNNCFNDGSSRTLQIDNLYTVPSTGAASSGVVWCAWLDYPELPPNDGIARRTWLYLEVYTCPGRPTGCEPGIGELGLRAQVAIFDALGFPDPPRRYIEVYSWDVQRLT